MNHLPSLGAQVVSLTFVTKLLNFVGENLNFFGKTSVCSYVQNYAFNMPLVKNAYQNNNSLFLNQSI